MAGVALVIAVDVNVECYVFYLGCCPAESQVVATSEALLELMNGSWLLQWSVWFARERDEGATLAD